MSKKNKIITAGKEREKELRLQRDTKIEELATDIIYNTKNFKEELKNVYPNRILSQVKSEIKNGTKYGFNTAFRNLKNNVIAPFYHDKVEDIIGFSKNTTILSNKESFTPISTYINNDALKDTYKRIDIKNSFFDVLEQYASNQKGTAPIQSGIQLINQVIAFDKINYSHTDIKGSQNLEHFNRAKKFFDESNQFLVYDLETLGGIDQYGNKKVNYLTEFSYGIYDKQKQGYFKKVETINGLTQSQADEIYKLIENVSDLNQISNEQLVTYRRIGLYGHSKTQFTKGSDGMYSVALAQLDDDYKFSKDELKEGIKRLRQVYDEQNIIQSSGLTSVQERMADMLAHMNDHSISKIGYNSTAADIPWLNHFLANNILDMTPEQQKIFLKRANLDSMFLSTSTEDWMDLLTAGRIASNNVGLAKFHPTEANRNASRGFSPLAQEGLTRGYFPEAYINGAAHSASFDIDRLIDLIVNPNGEGLNGKTYLEQVFQWANQSSYTNTEISTTGLDLFLSDSSYGYNLGKEAPLSYVYDPLNKQYRTGNQFLFDDSSIKRDSISERHTKRNRMYTIDFAGEINMNESWAKQLSGTHDDLAQQKLFAIKLTPYAHKEIAGAQQALQGHTMMFFQTKDQMEAFISNMTRIGTRDSISSEFKAVAGVEEMFKEYTFGKEGLEETVTAYDYNNLLKELTRRDINDNAARMIRDNDYSKAVNFGQFYDMLTEYNEGVPMTKKQMNKTLQEIFASQTQSISKTVAQGKTLTLGVQDIIRTLGWSDNAGHSHLMSNTLDNQITAYNYMSSQLPVASKVIQYLNGQELTPHERKWKYNQIMNSLIESTVEELSEGDPNKARSLWFNSSKQTIFGKDLDYFNFDLSGTIDSTLSKVEGFKRPIVDDDILRVNLGAGKHYELINKITNKYIPNYKTLSPTQKSFEQMTQLKKFINNVRDSKQHKGLFKEFTEERLSELTTPEMLSSEIIQSLRAYRKNNPEAGYITEAWTQNPDAPNKVMQHLAQSDNLLEKIIAINNDLPKYREFNYKNQESIGEVARSIVDDILVDKIDPFKFSKSNGFTTQQAKYFEELYYQTKAEYTDFMTNFITSFTKAGDTDFMYDAERKVFALMKGNEAVELSFPRLRAMDNNFFIDLNGSRIALHSKLDAKGITRAGKFNPDNIRFISTLGEAFEKSLGASSYSIAAVAEKGFREGNILNTVRSFMQNVNSYVKEGSSISANDILDVQTNYRINLEDLYDIAHVAAKDGLLDNLPFRDDNLLSLLKNSKEFSYATSTTTQRESLQKNIPALLQFIADKKHVDEDNIFSIIANNYSNYGKETQVSEAVGQIGLMLHKAGIQFDNMGRPVINQTRTTLYKEDKWKTAAGKKYFKDLVNINGIATNDFSRVFDNRTVTGIGRTIDKLVVKKANISEVGFKTGISEYFLTHTSEKEKQIYNRLKAVNLTEQEQIINARIMDEFFDKSHIQRINANKELAFYMNINEQTIQESKELSRISARFEIENGRVKFKYGNKVNKAAHEHLLTIQGYDSTYTQTAKINGMFGFGYFSKTSGMLIDEATINTMLKDVKSIDEARQLLKDTFDSSWYVQSIEQSNYKKILQGYVEKGMASAYYAGIGEFDSNVKAFIKEASKVYNYGDLSGKVLTKDFIEKEIIRKYGSKEFKLAREAGGFKSKEELRKAIYSERYIIQDELDKIFGKVGIYSNHNQPGHKNSQLAFEELIYNMRDARIQSGQTESEAMNSILKELKANKVINFEGYDSNQLKLVDNKIYYPNELKGLSFYDNNALKKIIQSNSIYKDLEEGKDIIVNGKVVGKLSHTSISESHSFQGLSGHTEEEYISAIADIDKKIKEAKSKKEIAELREIRSGLAASYDFNTKGQKITDRELQLLNFHTYDNDFTRRAYEAMNDKDLFESTYGHVLKTNEQGKFIINEEGNYVLKDEYLGRPMLKDYTDDLLNQKRMQGELLKASSNLEEYYTDKDVRQGIKKLINNSGTLSKEYAENVYALSRGKLANKFNLGDYRNLDKMSEEGFHLIKAGDIYRTFKEGEESLNHQNSIFNKNLMIDLGEDLGNKRYVALPYSPASMTGDIVIKKNYQKSLFSTLKAYDDLAAFNNHTYIGKKSKEELITTLQQRADELVSQINLFTEGKEGIASAFHLRQKASVSGVTSSAVVLNPEELQGESAKLFKDSWNKLLNKYDGESNKVYKALSEMNNPALSQSMFEGKSILQHYSEGRYINARWGSIEQFKELGMFNEDYMKSVGVSTEEEMMELLRTKGIMTNTIRPPSIYVDSTSPTMMYLDDSLKGNQTKLLMEGQFALNGDNDADIISSSKWLLNDMDSLQAEAQGAIKNNSWSDTKANMLYRATTSAKFYHDKTLKTLQDDYELAKTNSNYFTLTGDKGLDNRVYAAYGLSPSSKAINENQSILNEFNELYKKKYNEIFDVTEDNALKNADALLDGMDDAIKQKYHNAIMFDYSFGANEIAGQAKVRKRAIGEINTSLFKLRKATDLVYDSSNSARQRSIMQHLAVEIEQEVISAKKGSVRYDVNTTEQFNTALRNLLSPNKDKNSTGQSQMSKWMNETSGMSKRLDSVIQKLEKERLIDSSNYTKKNLINDFINIASGIAATDYNKLNAYESYGSRNRALSRENLKANALDVVSTKQGSFKNQVVKDALGAGLMDAEVLEQKQLNKQNLEHIHKAERRHFKAGIEKQQINRQSLTRSITEIAGSFHDGLKQLSSSKMGMATIAFSAAYMLTGFMGNNASQPVEAEQVMPQNSPQLADQQYSMQANNTSNPNGYVINIRGNGSPQSMARAQQVMNQSLSQSIGGNLNIRMNITDSNGNINDRYLDELISNAIQ